MTGDPSAPRLPKRLSARAHRSAGQSPRQSRSPPAAFARTLTATIGHVVDKDAIRPTQLGRPQDKEIRLVFDLPHAFWRFTEIGDDAVLRRHGIYLSLRDALDPQVGASLTEAMPCGEALDRLYLDLDERHTKLPALHHSRPAYVSDGTTAVAQRQEKSSAFLECDVYVILSRSLNHLCRAQRASDQIPPATKNNV